MYAPPGRFTTVRKVEHRRCLARVGQSLFSVSVRLAISVDQVHAILRSRAVLRQSVPRPARSRASVPALGFRDRSASSRSRNASFRLYSIEGNARLSPRRFPCWILFREECGRGLLRARKRGPRVSTPNSSPSPRIRRQPCGWFRAGKRRPTSGAPDEFGGWSPVVLASGIRLRPCPAFRHHETNNARPERLRVKRKGIVPH